MHERKLWNQIDKQHDNVEEQTKPNRIVSSKNKSAMQRVSKDERSSARYAQNEKRSKRRK
jgi:hypothetical protein